MSVTQICQTCEYVSYNLKETNLQGNMMWYEMGPTIVGDSSQTSNIVCPNF